MERGTLNNPGSLDVDVTILDGRLPGWGFPHWGSAEAAALDLHACLPEPLVLPPGSAPVLVPAGFAMRIREPGWCGLVAPRSGLGHRGLVLGNTIGVIDADYTGEITLSAWNRNGPGGSALTLSPGDRVAQLAFVRVGRPAFRVVQGFATPTGRGADGFGSTGVAPDNDG